MDHLHAVILAGGAGTRLWPLSRRARPKQLLRLFGGKSLLQHARLRLDGLIPADNIWVVTAEEQGASVRAELPELRPEQVIGEPAMRDTANAIGLAANLLQQRDQDAVMAILTADHLITPIDVFQQKLRMAAQAAVDQPDALVTFAIKPTEPHCGYGYLKLGDAVSDGVQRVDAFKEKPDWATAEAYFADGQHYWNSGMFVWKTTAILNELSRLLPENAATLTSLAADWHTASKRSDIAKQYADLQRTSIDFGVMEKARNVLAIELDCEWIDVGSWASVASLTTADDADNQTIGSPALTFNAEGNLLVNEDNEHVVVAIGVQGLAIIRTPDATLVCNRQHLHKVKEAVKEISERFGDRFA